VTDLQAEPFQACSDDCRPGAHAVTVFVELGATRDEVLERCVSMRLPVLDLEDRPDAKEIDEDVPDGWRVWLRTTEH
jgi:hypothetical protein